MWYDMFHQAVPACTSIGFRMEIFGLTCFGVCLAGFACDARTPRAENEMFYRGKTVGSIKQDIEHSQFEILIMNKITQVCHVSSALLLCRERCLLVSMYASKLLLIPSPEEILIRARRKRVSSFPAARSCC